MDSKIRLAIISRSLLMAGTILTLFVGCSTPGPTVNASALAKIKHVAAFANFDGSQVELVDAEISKESQQAFSIVAVETAISDSNALDAAFKKDSPFTVQWTDIPTDTNILGALNNTNDSGSEIRAKLSDQLGVDGLLMITRSYRLRRTSHLYGDPYSEWNGEVKSRMWMFSREGHLVLDIPWVSVSKQKERGASLSVEQATSLLSDAVEQAETDTISIQQSTSSGQGIPKNLATEESLSAQQDTQRSVAETGVWIRGGIIIVLIVAVLYLGLAVEENKALAIIGALISLAILLYLLIARGWWSDTVVTIIDLIINVVFG